MKVLLVCQAYQPDPRVGSIRAKSVADAFRAAGHEVLVVTAALPGETPGLRASEPGHEVHAVAIGELYRLRLAQAVRRFGRRRGASAVGAGVGAGDPSSGSGSANGRGRAGLLQRTALSLLWLPDDEQRFIRPALAVARRLLPRGVDVVYTTAPSFSTHLVGLRLRRTAPVRWVAEFRDPWVGEWARPAHDVPLVRRLDEWLERRCLETADRVVTVTEQTGALYRDRLGPGLSAKVVTVRNGIANFESARRDRGQAPFRIVYSGSIYGERDPRAFLAVLADVVRERGLGPDDLVVDLYVGVTRSAGSVPLESFVAGLGIAAHVRFHDWISRTEMLRTLPDADLLLLLAQRQPLQVPNKLYEYLGARVPIFAFADDEGETAQMLRRAGGHYVLTSEERGPIETALRDALARRDGSPASSTDVLEEWRTDRQMQRLVAMVTE